MAELENTFEGGTDGATITTGNSGGASGDAFSAITGTGTAVYDDDAPAPLKGAMSARVAAASGQTRILELSWGSTKSEVWARVYLWKGANPTNSTNILELALAGTGGCDVRITSTGTLQFRDGTKTNRATSAALANDTLHRIEWRILHSTTVGRIEGRVFSGANADGTTPDQTLGSSSTNRNTGTGSDELWVGVVSNPGTAGLTLTIDDVKLSDAGWIGPSAGAEQTLDLVPAEITVAGVAAALTATGSAELVLVPAVVAVAAPSVGVAGAGAAPLDLVPATVTVEPVPAGVAGAGSAELVLVPAVVAVAAPSVGVAGAGAAPLDLVPATVTVEPVPAGVAGAGSAELVLVPAVVAVAAPSVGVAGAGSAPLDLVPATVAVEPRPIGFDVPLVLVLPPANVTISSVAAALTATGSAELVLVPGVVHVAPAPAVITGTGSASLDLAAATVSVSGILAEIAAAGAATLNLAPAELNAVAIPLDLAAAGSAELDLTSAIITVAGLPLVLAYAADGASLVLVGPRHLIDAAVRSLVDESAPRDLIDMSPPVTLEET